MIWIKKYLIWGKKWPLVKIWHTEKNKIKCKTLAEKVTILYIDNQLLLVWSWLSQRQTSHHCSWHLWTWVASQQYKIKSTRPTQSYCSWSLDLWSELSPALGKPIKHDVTLHLLLYSSRANVLDKTKYSEWYSESPDGNLHAAHFQSCRRAFTWPVTWVSSPVWRTLSCACILHRCFCCCVVYSTPESTVAQCRYKIEVFIYLVLVQGLLSRCNLGLKYFFKNYTSSLLNNFTLENFWMGMYIRYYRYWIDRLKIRYVFNPVTSLWPHLLKLNSVWCVVFRMSLDPLYLYLFQQIWDSSGKSIINLLQ